MNTLQDFEGDLMLIDTTDGGEILIEDGLFVDCRSFDTAVYISLFGGNKDDSGKVKNKKTWWGNLLSGTTESEMIVSRLQSVVACMPMSTKNILEAEKAAYLDLKWLIDERALDRINIESKAVSKNTFSLKIMLEADGKNIYENTFSILWKAGIYGSL